MAYRTHTLNRLLSCFCDTGFLVKWGLKLLPVPLKSQAEVSLRPAVIAKFFLSSLLLGELTFALLLPGVYSSTDFALVSEGRMGLGSSKDCKHSRKASTRSIPRSPRMSELGLSQEEDGTSP